MTKWDRGQELTVCVCVCVCVWGTVRGDFLEKVKLR